ncbi:hypothetical protein [Telluribacter humicola]|uniref:hypothetical protein n=1 Tax=Telluribacter humicola TaxID=1720261 RepID=UPI001A9629C1|nr:hypothetical protein [Telluribacter humicola]
MLNGGNLVPNENLASTLLENSINGYFNTDSFQVLNISAGTWGPDNGMAFIQKHGDFDADLICLVYNSHDAGDTMEFNKVVGVELQKPDKNESLATIAFFKRMVLPRISTFLHKEEPASSKKMVSELNPGWTFFYELSNQKGIPLIVYLHATQEEAHNKRYDQEGQKIIEFCNRNNIRMVMDINKQSDDLFVDYIHLNSEGQKMITDILFPEIISQFEVASN